MISLLAAELALSAWGLFAGTEVTDARAQGAKTMLLALSQSPKRAPLGSTASRSPLPLRVRFSTAAPPEAGTKRLTNSERTCHFASASTSSSTMNTITGRIRSQSRQRYWADEFHPLLRSLTVGRRERSTAAEQISEMHHQAKRGYAFCRYKAALQAPQIQP